jgi:hypothetical protein
MLAPIRPYVTDGQANNAMHLSVNALATGTALPAGDRER